MNKSTIELTGNMKAGHTLLGSISVLFLSLLLNCNVLAYAILRCDEIKEYCDYQGMYQNIDNAVEEFQMLSEPPRHGNFQQMFSVLLYIFDCAKTNESCMEKLMNPDCNISKYTKKLVNFYEDNKASINDELVVGMFEEFKNGKGRMFFDKKEVN